MSIAMATLVLALLAAPSLAAAVVKRAGRNCSAGCGGFEIPPYPFGVGQECSLPGFNLSCAYKSDYFMVGKPSIRVDYNSSYLMLGKPSIRVDFDLQCVSDHSPFPTIRTSIEYFVRKMLEY
ncbi:unnamed protein product [Urochloa humidicola]